ncbi:DUF1430 domain-containing protein [Clostridium sp. B9]|uniref:DUF1430 domain-containing protein n=1 Tax=Clostridium sp. B9 TaxID=3423224 RepID=UPI003D2ED8A0
MKKKVALIILFIIITILSFEGVYSVRNHTEFMKLKNLQGDLENFEVTISIPDRENYDTAYESIIKSLDKYNGNIFFSEVDIKEDLKKYINYGYFSNEETENHIPIASGRFFDEKDNIDSYLSTIDSENIQQIGVINDFSGKNIHEIRTIKSKLDINTFENLFIVQIENEQILDKLIEDLEVESIIVQKRVMGSSNQYNTETLKIILVVCFIGLIFMIFYQILGSYKKIGIQKLLGHSTFLMLKERLLEVLWIEVSVMLVVTVLLVFLNFNTFNILFWEFIIELICIYSIMLIFTTVSVILPYIYVSKITVSNIIKNKRPVKSIIILNNIVKVILASIVLIFFSNALDNLSSIGKGYEENYKVWEETKEYYILPELGFNDESIQSFSIEEMEKERAVYLHFNKQGAILADFNMYEPASIEEAKQMLPEEYMRENIIVNPNYLLKHKVYDVDGNIVNISEDEKDRILLVPEKYRNFEKEILEYYDYNSQEPCSSTTCSHKTADGKLNLVEQKQKIIWMKSNQKYFSYLLDVNPEEGNCVTDPIVSVLTESNDKLVGYYKIIGYNNSPFKIRANSEEEVISGLEKYYDMSVYLIDPYNLYDNVASTIINIQAKVKVIIFAIVILLAVISIIILQNTSLYFNQNKNKIIVKKLHGYRLISRYMNYFIMVLITWTCPLAIASLITKDISIIYFTLILVAIELVFIIFNINLLEKKNLIKVIKGEY